MLRSTMAQGLQGLTAEELHARQTRQQQLQQHLAQQEAQRLQEQNVLQVAQLLIATCTSLFLRLSWTTMRHLYVCFCTDMFLKTMRPSVLDDSHSQPSSAQDARYQAQYCFVQARIQLEQQQRAKEAAHQQMAELETRRKAAELEAARQTLIVKVCPSWPKIFSTHTARLHRSRQSIVRCVAWHV